MNETQGHSSPPAPPAGPGYDTQDLPMAAVAGVGVGIMFALILTILGVQAYFDSIQERQVYIKVMEPIAEDFRNLRAQEEAELSKYEYVDRARGVVRIPIERAMELTAAESAAGRLFYPGRPAPVKRDEPEAPAAAGAKPAGAPAAAGAKPNAPTSQ